MFSIFEKKRSIGDLKQRKSIIKTHENKIGLREKITIAVIDDQPFTAQTNLSNNGFKFKYFSDLTDDLTLVKDYPIILCDLLGVGKHMNPTGQGAHIIRELKNNYPQKYVIAYSGGGPNTQLTKTAIELSDEFIKKDADIDTWLDALDVAIENVTDPVIVWRRFRDTLQAKHDISAHQLAKLENAYVKACLGNAGSDPAALLKKEATKIDDGSLIKTVEGFFDSVVFDLMIILSKKYINEAGN